MTKTNIGVRIIPEGRLRLARSPTAELADAALQAQQAAGFAPEVGCDFIVIAVAKGTADDALARELERVATAKAQPSAK